MVNGKFGAATRIAMSIIVRVAEVCDVDQLIDVSRAHIGGCTYLGEASLDFAEMFARLGGKVTIPTTLNIGSLDQYGWQSFPIRQEFAEKGTRIMEAYLQMGCEPTWTCAPYQAGHRPACGEHVVWAESNADVFANSVLGARTNRYGDYLDLCAGLTGRIPATGLHLTENRRGQILFRLDSLPMGLMQEESFYPVLGYLLGERSAEKIPVVEGLPKDMTDDQWKALGAAVASSGPAALVHAVGITPEARTLDEAFQGRVPERVEKVDMALLREVREKLSTCTDAPVDVVALGCPHFSLQEFLQLAALVKGKKRFPGVEIHITTSRFMRDQIRSLPAWAALERFGVRVIVDTCILHMRTVSPKARVLMTNSGKYAHYAPGILGLQVAFGNMADCVESAVRGCVHREDGVWKC